MAAVRQTFHCELQYISSKKKKKRFDKNFNLLPYYDTVYLKVQSKNTLFTGLLHFT